MSEVAEGRRFRPWRLLNYGIAAAALAYVLWALHLPTLSKDLGGVDWGLMLLAVAVDVLTILIQALRWRYLLRPSRVPFGTVLQATYVGTLFDEVLPLRTGELVRGLIVARRAGRGLATILSTEVVERVSDGLALVVLAWFAVRHLDLPPAVRVGQTVLEAVVAVLVIAGLLLALRGESLRERLLTWKPAGRTGVFVREVGVDLAAGLRVLRDTAAVTAAGLLALLMMSLQVLMLWLTLRAYQVDLTVLHAAAVLAIISGGTFLPSTPGSVGSWQFFCMLGLGLFGIDTATAAGFSFVAYVLLTLPLIGGGLIALTLSPFTFSELRDLPSSRDPLGGVLGLVAEEEGAIVSPGELGEGEAATVDRLFREYGYNCAAYLAAESPLPRFLASGSRGFVTFMPIAGVAVALGEPVASSSDLVEVVHGFEAAVATRGVSQIAFYGVTSGVAEDLRRAGYRLMPLGPEAVFHLGEFSLEGGHMKSIRHQVNHLRKQGSVVVAEFVPRGPHGEPMLLGPEGASPPLSAEETLRQMRETARAWEEGRNVGAVGFTISPPRLDDPGLRRYFVLFLDARVEGFFTYEPIPARNGWYLDNERRRLDSPQGVGETLVAESHRLLALEGASMVSWGTTALAQPAPDRYREEHRLLAQAFTLAFQHLDFIYPFQGLFENKQKYHPAWEETYVAFRPRFGPRMAYAIVKAHHPEGVSDLLLSRLRTGRDVPEDGPPGPSGAREESRDRSTAG